MNSKECSICGTTDNVKKCKCGSYYCEIHMSFHLNYFCSYGKKGKKTINKESLDE